MVNSEFILKTNFLATNTPRHQITQKLDIHNVFLVRFSVLVFWWQILFFDVWEWT